MNNVSHAALTVAQLTQSFRSGFWMKEKEILHGISFSLPSGKTLGLLGPNGAGKTTLIHCLTGIRTPKSGSVFIAGSVGYLPERPLFHEFLTGLETLKYFGQLSKIPDGQIKSRSIEVLRKVGIEHAKDLKVSQYSKGMQQRLGIAQAILHEPEVLILDEPMSGLDPNGRKEIRDLIRSLSAEGRTLLFSTHVVSDIEDICDTIAMIRNGNLEHFGDVQVLLNESTKGYEVKFQDERGALNTLLRPTLDEAQAVLKETLQSNRLVLSFRPIRKTLEEVFFS